jgi:hypothetical protein
MIPMTIAFISLLAPATHDPLPQRSRSLTGAHLEILWRLHRMRVVVAEYSFAIGFMQRQAIADSMWDVRRPIDLPRFDLDPVAAALIDAFIVKAEGGSMPGSSRMT